MQHDSYDLRILRWMHHDAPITWGPFLQFQRVGPIKLRYLLTCLSVCQPVNPSTSQKREKFHVTVLMATVGVIAVTKPHFATNGFCVNQPPLYSKVSKLYNHKTWYNKLLESFRNINKPNLFCWLVLGLRFRLSTKVLWCGVSALCKPPEWNIQWLLSATHQPG